MGLFDSLFGGGGGGSPTVKFEEIPQTKEAKEARKRLFGFATGEPPEVPRRKTAPLEPMGEERQLARTTAKEMIQPQDIFSLPEVQGIIQEATEKGNLLANRIGRALQASGNITSTTGRDVLGRVVTDVQKNLASSLAPFAMEERQRRRSLIPTLEGLGLTEELRKMGFTQDELDALFQQEYEESKQLETFTIPLLKSIIGLQPGVQPIVSGGTGQTSLEGLSGLIGPLLTSVLGSGGSGGGGLDIGKLLKTAAPIAGGASALLPFLLMCDVRVKENFALIENALEKVNQLEGLTYHFIGEDRQSAGIIAQELEKVLPEGVVEHKGLKYIRMDAVVGLLVNAINEMNQKIEELRSN